MIEYFISHFDKLGEALFEHVQLLLITMAISLVIAGLLTILAMYSSFVGSGMIHLFSVIYSTPSLALFAILIPVTGLGQTTAIIVLVAYNQYLLLRNFIEGLNQVDQGVILAATGMGMTRLQILVQVRIPLAKDPLVGGIKLAIVSTVGVGTIAALINAGGLGDILLSGMRTMDVNKIVWGCILSAGLALLASGILGIISRDKKRE